MAMHSVKIWQGVLVAAGMTLASSAANAAPCSAAATEINPGTAITGVTGAICNGSTTSPTGGAAPASENAIYLGFNAAFTDTFTMAVNGTIFTNNTTPLGTTATVSVSTPLTLSLTDVNTGATYNSGVGYANSDGSGTAYHFADFTFANAAAYDAFAPFDSITGNLTGAEDAYILSHGGYAAFTFVGIEDLHDALNDDWNDLIVAVSAVPIPATLPLFAGGLAAFGLLGRRRKQKASAAIAAA